MHSSDLIVLRTLGGKYIVFDSARRASLQFTPSFQKLEKSHTVKCKQLEWGFVFDLLFVSNLFLKTKNF